MKRLHAAAGLLIVGLWCAARGAQNRTLKDDLGFPFPLASPPQRIVSMAPNITEILFALNLGKRVVGVTRYCDFPGESKEKEIIGGLVDPNLEKIQDLVPDLIIGFRGNPIRTIERLHSLGLPVFVLETGTSLKSVFSIITKVGIITHQNKEAAALIRSMEERYCSIQAVLQGVQQEPKVFFSLHGMTLWTFGQGSFLDDLSRQARGVNIAGKIPRKWLLFNREQLFHENPEVIVILSKSPEEFVRAKQWFENDAVLKNLEAVQKNRIYFLDEDLATRPGPRIIEALDRLARILHPLLFEAK